MSNRVVRKALAYAAIYVVVSLALEAAILIFLRWKIPQDNYRIAPCVLTIPPLLAAWLGGYRRPKEFFAMAAITALLTLLITLTVTRLTGINTGLIEPLFNRGLAGFLAATVIEWRRAERGTS